MPDYTNGKIYKIVCNETGEVYYGSTTQKISQRVAKHKQPKELCMAKQILNRGNFDYSLVEDYPCDNKEQLHRRERWFIENCDCINKVIPLRTQQEYREQNKELRVEYDKIYRQTNLERIKENKKEYYEKNKTEINKKMVEYGQKHKEDKKLYDKKYNHINKEKITAYKKEKVICECGCVTARSNLSTHKLSAKHIELMKLE